MSVCGFFLINNNYGYMNVCLNISKFYFVGDNGGIEICMVTLNMNRIESRRDSNKWGRG